MFLNLALIIVSVWFEANPALYTELPSDSFVQLLLLARWDKAALEEWDEGCEKTGGTPGWKVAEVEGTTLAEPLRRSRFLEESETDSDIKEGSGFPRASALFLGDWNVLTRAAWAVSLSNGFTTRQRAGLPDLS